MKIIGLHYTHVHPMPLPIACACSTSSVVWATLAALAANEHIDSHSRSRLPCAVHVFVG